MKNNIFISVIIPVYNVEPYIERCFWSVVSQTYRNYECIFIDDCGTDHSIEILQKLISEYKGNIPLKIIRHEYNRGASASRNSGMAIASGSFFYFADSDDYISPDALSKLVEKTDAHFDVIYGRSLIIKGNDCYLSEIEYPERSNLDFDFFYHSLNNRMGCVTTVCNRLYRRDFLETYRIRFCEGNCFEDVLFNAEIFMHHPRLLEIDQVTYFYAIRKNSVSTSFTAQKFENEIAAVELLKNILTENNSHDDLPVKRLIGQRYLRLLIIAPDYGKAFFKKAFDLIHARGFLWKEWKALLFRHKVLYIYVIMPKFLSYFYCLFIILAYRSFIWNKRKW